MRLGRFVRTAMGMGGLLLAAACVNPLGLVLPGFPVRVTVDAVVDGEPVRVVRLVHCAKHDAGTRNLALTWYQDVEHATVPLRDGGHFMVEFSPSMCNELDAKWPVERMAPPVIGWADDLVAPKLIYVFSPMSRALRPPRFDAASLRFRYERADSVGKGEEAVEPWEMAWFPPGREPLFPPRPRLLISGNVEIIPKVEWTRINALADRMPFVLEPSAVLTADETEAIRLEGQFGTRPRLATAAMAPLRYLGNDTWEPDELSAGTKIYYALDHPQRDRLGNDRQFLEGWLLSQQVIYRDRAFAPRQRKRNARSPSLVDPAPRYDLLFDPRTQRMLWPTNIMLTRIPG